MTIENFAHYKIIKSLGKGGMGEVFLVEDTKLSRRAALKFLSSEASLNRERLHRFEQEAHAISSLNHPNILTIYDFGQFDGREYIATEFVDGETLREHLAHNAADLQKILEIFAQIAAALEAAHENGIIHRDIKSENIMIRRDGLVKILDFGLAKLAGKTSEMAVAVDAEAPTRANLSTAPGLVMGTSFYLSPEQSRGKKVDARTDIWSFGVVLYEAITKTYPFNGETTSDVIASILKTEPAPLNLYMPQVPAELQRIVKKTLRKNCDERYQSVTDLIIDLKKLSRELNAANDSEFSAVSPETQDIAGDVYTDRIGGVSTKPPTADSYFAKTPNHSWMFPLIGLGLLLLFAAGWYVWRHYSETATVSSTPLAVTQLVSWKNDLGEKMQNHARFSPDGRFIVFSSTNGGGRDIWLKQMSGGDAIQRTKNETAASNPIWSADGEQIAFLSAHGGQPGIWKMPALSGAPVLIKPLDGLDNYKLVHWSKDGKTIYYDFQRNLYALDIATQQEKPLTNFELVPYIERYFRFSPNEESVVYVDGNAEQKEIWIMQKDGGKPQRLTGDATNDSNPVWLPDGKRIVYNSARNHIKQIWTAFTDGRPPAQLSINNDDSDILDVSSDGSKILYFSEKDDADLWGVNLNAGKEFQVTSDLGLELWADVAPDNSSIVYQETNLSNAVNLLNGSLIKKSLKPDGQSIALAEDGFEVRWSPDGTRVAFLRRNPDSTTNLWMVGSEGGNARQLSASNIIFGGNSYLVPYNQLETQDYQWSPDGKSLIFCAKKDGVSNVRQVAADGANETALSDNNEPKLIFFSPMLSPDGQRVAWLSLLPDKKFLRSVWISEAGKAREIYQSNSLTHLVGWSASGKELIVRTIEGETAEPQVTRDVDLFSLSLDGATRPIARLPQTHFQNIQLSPDGKNIAYMTRADGVGSLQIILANGGNPKTIVTGNDTRVYFSNLVWSPDGKNIYYGKQASWSVISMIENFK
ncbi:MAG: protein kinase domain-containing protein [Pyrinomonadaceae bacterium]